MGDTAGKPGSRSVEKATAKGNVTENYEGAGSQPITLPIEQERGALIMRGACALERATILRRLPLDPSIPHTLSLSLPWLQVQRPT